MNPSTRQPQDILDFWFDEISPKEWWVVDADFDQQLARRFGALHTAAVCCELHAWRASAQGRLAEIIVLDQFSRNIYRNTPQAFASDPLALALAQTAVSCGADRELDTTQRAFIYMPYMHSESLLIHRHAVTLFSQPGMKNSLDFELKHQQIIQRFGRYPHRNAILGRASTQEEIDFLQTPGSSF